MLETNYTLIAIATIVYMFWQLWENRRANWKVRSLIISLIIIGCLTVIWGFIVLGVVLAILVMGYLVHVAYMAWLEGNWKQRVGLVLFIIFVILMAFFPPPPKSQHEQAKDAWLERKVGN